MVDFAELSGSGGQPTVLTWKAGGQAWESLPNTWESLGGAVSNASHSGTTVNLDTGKQFSDYHELFFHGGGQLNSITVPRAAFEGMTGSGTSIYLTEGTGGASRLWYVNDTSYKIDVEAGHEHHHDIHGVWGRKA